MPGPLDPNDISDSCETSQIHEGAVSKAREIALEEETVQRLAGIFKVMGDPTRLRIINALSRGEMCVCDIAYSLKMENSAISHQLRILKTVRLVKFRKDGKCVYYSLDDEHMLTLFDQGLKHVRHQ